jgi:hypothetical protein
MKKSILFLISSYILLVVLTTVYAVAAKNHYNSANPIQTENALRDTTIQSPIKHVVLLNETSDNSGYISIDTDTAVTSACILHGDYPNTVKVSGDTLFYSVNISGGQLHLKDKIESISGKNVRLSISGSVLSAEQCSITLSNTDEESRFHSNSIQIEEVFRCKNLTIDLKNIRLDFTFYSHSNFVAEDVTLNLIRSEFGIIHNDNFLNNFNVGSLLLHADSLSNINVPTQCLLNMRIQ